MGSPVGSAVHIQDEVCTGPSVGKVISGDDIDSLAINLDELKKVSACSPLDSELYLIKKRLKLMMPIIQKEMPPRLATPLDSGSLFKQ